MARCSAGPYSFIGGFVFFLFHVPLVSDLQTAFMLGIPDPAALIWPMTWSIGSRHRRQVRCLQRAYSQLRAFLNKWHHAVITGEGARVLIHLYSRRPGFVSARTYPNFNYVSSP